MFHHQITLSNWEAKKRAIARGIETPFNIAEWEPRWEAHQLENLGQTFNFDEGLVRVALPQDDDDQDENHETDAIMEDSSTSDDEDTGGNSWRGVSAKSPRDSAAKLIDGYSKPLQKLKRKRPRTERGIAVGDVDHLVEKKGVTKPMAKRPDGQQGSGGSTHAPPQPRAEERDRVLGTKQQSTATVLNTARESATRPVQSTKDSTKLKPPAKHLDSSKAPKPPSAALSDAGIQRSARTPTDGTIHRPMEPQLPAEATVRPGGSLSGVARKQALPTQIKRAVQIQGLTTSSILGNNWNVPKERRKSQPGQGPAKMYKNLSTQNRAAKRGRADRAPDPKALNLIIAKDSKPVESGLLGTKTIAQPLRPVFQRYQEEEQRKALEANVTKRHPATEQVHSLETVDAMLGSDQSDDEESGQFTNIDELFEDTLPAQEDATGPAETSGVDVHSVSEKAPEMNEAAASHGLPLSDAAALAPTGMTSKALPLTQGEPHSDNMDSGTGANEQQPAATSRLDDLDVDRDIDTLMSDAHAADVEPRHQEDQLIDQTAGSDAVIEDTIVRQNETATLLHDDLPGSDRMDIDSQAKSLCENPAASEGHLTKSNEVPASERPVITKRISLGESAMQNLRLLSDVPVETSTMSSERAELLQKRDMAPQHALPKTTPSDYHEPRGRPDTSTPSGSLVVPPTVVEDPEHAPLTGTPYRSAMPMSLSKLKTFTTYPAADVHGHLVLDTDPVKKVRVHFKDLVNAVKYLMLTIKEDKDVFVWLRHVCTADEFRTLYHEVW